MSEQCPKCKKFPLYPNVHRCWPFEVAKPWRDQVADHEWLQVYARSAEDAAVTFAETSDAEGDYTIIRNREGEVWVRDPAGEVTKWEIEAETVPQYYAREKRAASREGASP